MISKRRVLAQLAVALTCLALVSCAAFDAPPYDPTTMALVQEETFIVPLPSTFTERYEVDPRPTYFRLMAIDDKSLGSEPRFADALNPPQLVSPLPIPAGARTLQFWCYGQIRRRDRSERTFAFDAWVRTSVHLAAGTEYIVRGEPIGQTIADGLVFSIVEKTSGTVIQRSRVPVAATWLD